MLGLNLKHVCKSGHQLHIDEMVTAVLLMTILPTIAQNDCFVRNTQLSIAQVQNLAPTATTTTPNPHPPSIILTSEVVMDKTDIHSKYMLILRPLFVSTTFLTLVIIT